MRRYFLQHDRKLVDRAIRIYLSGKSIWEVGRIIGYSGQAVNRALTYAEVPRRHGIQPIGALHVSKGRTYVKTKNGWRLRYRHLLAEKYGEHAIAGKHVHHDDENPLNDREENLKVVTPSQHRGITNKSHKMRQAAKKGWIARRSKQ